VNASQLISLKSPSEIEAMRESGRVVAHALAAVREAAVPGATLRQLDALAEGVIRDAGATPSFLGYHPGFAPTPFSGSVCVSVNDVIVHGAPSGQRLRHGDLLSVDCGALLDGWHGDAAITICVGEVSAEDRRLVAATEDALDAGIAAAQVGGRLTDISFAVAEVAARHGFGTIDDFGGHGIGRALHEPPSLPNASERPGRGMKLRDGLVLAIEPMLDAGRGRYVVRPDGWTVATADGSRAAHAEHTVAITADGPRILTLP